MQGGNEKVSVKMNSKELFEISLEYPPVTADASYLERRSAVSTATNPYLLAGALAGGIHQRCS